MRLFTYSYWHPAYKNCLTLDCVADDREGAMAKALRFLRSENARLKRARLPWKVRLPTHVNEMQDPLEIRVRPTS